MARILITGGSGLVGTALTKELLRSGHAVRHLSRSKRSIPDVDVFQWDVKEASVQAGTLTEVDAIVHLAGAGIVDKPWTEERLRELERSRADAALLLLNQPGADKIKAFVSASGINYYGTLTTDKVFEETNEPGDDIVARLTITWENAVDQWAKHCRVVKLRTPMVLAKEGGAMEKLSTPCRWGLGSPLGSGKQWMPWIHIDDLVACYIKAITDETMQGSFNIVADEQLQNSEFMRTLTQALHRPFFMPAVPAFILKMILGQRSALILNGARASNEKLIATGFKFHHTSLRGTLSDLLS